MSGDLVEVLGSIGRPRVLVVGDLILDRYVWGETQRISPEAPIPVLSVQEQDSRPGGAGNVVNALAGLDVAVSCCGAVGNDEDGRTLAAMIQALCAGACEVLVDPDRPTTVKTRFIGYVQSARRAMHHILRVDNESTDVISESLEAEFVSCVERLLAEQDAVIISDYAKGLLPDAALQRVLGACRSAGVPAIVDPRLGGDYSAYAGAALLTPNRYETQVAAGGSIRTGEEMRAAAETLCAALNLEAIVMTLDRDGMYLYEAERTESGVSPRHAALYGTEPREVYDVTGAGDVVVSVLGMCMGAGVGLPVAVQLANAAAGIEVGKVGAARVTRGEIAAELRVRESGLSEKLKTHDELLKILEERRRKNEVIVFTNGCFDLLHVGHMEYLKFARQQGDLLVVALNSDRSVRELKGAGRPILKETDRARLLAALEYVDYVVMFDETTPEKLIKETKPSVLVKGEDWREKGVVGREVVESYGGRVVLAPFVEGVSTTEIVSRIIETYGNAQS